MAGRKNVKNLKALKGVTPALVTVSMQHAGSAHDGKKPYHQRASEKTTNHQ